VVESQKCLTIEMVLPSSLRSLLWLRYSDIWLRIVPVRSCRIMASFRAFTPAAFSV